jgi:hypothetical protein
MKSYFIAGMGIVALLAVPLVGRAQGDPSQAYYITPQAGPFAILVKGFTGVDAQNQAFRLAEYLRQQRWPAYVYDYTPEIERQNKEFLEARYKDYPPEARPHRMIRVDPQWGVFIGGYRDFDSASKDLPNVKKTPEPPDYKDVDLAEPLDKKRAALYHLNLFAQCIATRNPTVRMQRADPNAPDPAWKNLNDGRPYNLLTKCPGEWTLVVKQFQATGAIQPRSGASGFLDKLFGGGSGDMLEAGANQAEEIAKVLRGDGFHLDAYVLHTRTGSIVTVGGYASINDPRMQELARKLADFSFGKTPDAIHLFKQPLPMKVPRL